MKIRETKSGKGVMSKLNVCEGCNKPFLSNKSTAVWCGNTCKVKGYRKRINKALIKKIKEKYGL